MNIENAVAEMRRYFLSGGMLSVETRIERLKRLKAAIRARESQIAAALQADFRKSEFDTYMTEIGMVYGEIDTAVKHLRKWARPKKVRLSLANFPAKGRLYAEGYGVVLIIAPWNYPFQLAMSPLVGAVAAGNCAVVKPASRTAATAQAIADVIADVFAPIEVTTTFERSGLLETQFDYIFFTGGASSGRAVMAAAAKYLTPVTLELGGKSPCIVDRTADIARAAKRIAWGKYLNAGQTCVAPDYLLLHADVYDAFLTAFTGAVRDMYYDGQDFLRDAFPEVCDREKAETIAEALSRSRVLFGGAVDGCTVEPTAVASDWDGEWMAEEIFAPVLPVLRFTDSAEILEKINARPRPLALYYFGDDAQRFIDGAPFGGGCINDTVMHVAEHALPFGGVGQSGMGLYHGKHSFDTFTHYKSILVKGKAEFSVKYPPHTDQKLNFIRKVLK